VTMHEFLNWCSDHGTGIALFCLFIGIPVVSMFIGFAKWAVKTAAGNRPCPQCGWPHKVLQRIPPVGGDQQ
jgi:hypothetical protein